MELRHMRDLEKRKKNFVEKARKLHNDFYSYSQISYTNNSSKVEIVCPTHGAFSQSPSNHLAGKGCPKCKGEKISSEKTKDTAYFITKAKEVHGDTYSYENSVYVKAQDKLLVTCKLHGDFSITANSHLNGRGCPVCASEKRKTPKYKQKDFTAIAGKKIDNKFKYGKYKGIKQPIKITCPLHGTFEQIADHHIQSNTGCPKCGLESLIGSYQKLTEAQKQFPCFLYVVKLEEESKEYIKVGITIRPESRYSCIKTKSKTENFSVLKEFEATLGECFSIEQHIHKKYRDKKYEPKEKFGGHSECFCIESTDQIIKEIEQLYVNKYYQE